MVGKEVGSVWVPKGGGSHGNHCGFPWSLPFATSKIQTSKDQSVCQSLNHVRLFVTPWTVALQALSFMKFSRQEYWSGLPLSSPGDLPNPGIEPGSPTLQVDSLPAEPQRKPKDTGVGSLSLLQCIFLNQESNHSLLHCKQILYQLSYQGSPEDIHYESPIIITIIIPTLHIKKLNLRNVLQLVKGRFGIQTQLV